VSALASQGLHHEVVAIFMQLEPVMPWQAPSSFQPVLQLSILRLPAIKPAFDEMSITQLYCYAQIGMGSVTHQDTQASHVECCNLHAQGS